MARNYRKRYFVDRKVQGSLAFRAVVYVLLVMVLTALLGTIGFVLVDGPMSGRRLVELMWSRFGLAWVASVLLIPIVVIDCIRLSNRFAGPMLRLRRAMKDVAAGKQVEPIKFRDGDFWYDFAEDFNRMLLQRKAEELVANRNESSSESVSSDTAILVS